MSKIEEKIEKYSKKSIVTISGTDIEIVEKENVLKDLREIQVEQEELQKKADAYDEHAESYASLIESYEQLQEQNKPAEVPAHVAKWISKYKKYGYTLYQALSYIPQDAKKWYLENAALCESAWVNGYTVKQQLYYVDFMSGDIHKRLIRDPENGVFDIVEWSRNLIGVVDEMFTESEIKAIDERYLPFAVEVEEVEK